MGGTAPTAISTVARGTGAPGGSCRKIADGLPPRVSRSSRSRRELSPGSWMIEPVYVRRQHTARLGLQPGELEPAAADCRPRSARRTDRHVPRAVSVPRVPDRVGTVLRKGQRGGAQFENVAPSAHLRWRARGTRICGRRAGWRHRRRAALAHHAMDCRALRARRRAARQHQHCARDPAASALRELVHPLPDDGRHLGPDDRSGDG